MASRRKKAKKTRFVVVEDDRAAPIAREAAQAARAGNCPEALILIEAAQAAGGGPSTDMALHTLSDACPRRGLGAHTHYVDPRFTMRANTYRRDPYNRRGERREIRRAIRDEDVSRAMDAENALIDRLDREVLRAYRAHLRKVAETDRDPRPGAFWRRREAAQRGHAVRKAAGRGKVFNPVLRGLDGLAAATFSPTPTRHPILTKLITQRRARVEANGEIVGIASDGTEVRLGSGVTPMEVTKTERYLKTHPDPSDW